MTRTVQVFDFEITAVGPSSGRYRASVPDQPMPSPAAGDALLAAVDEIARVLSEHGLEVVRSGFGVRGTGEFA